MKKSVISTLLAEVERLQARKKLTESEKLLSALFWDSGTSIPKAFLLPKISKRLHAA